MANCYLPKSVLCRLIKVPVRPEEMFFSKPGSKDLKNFVFQWEAKHPGYYSEEMDLDYPDYPEGFKYDFRSNIGINRMFESDDTYIVDVWEGYPENSDKLICNVVFNVKTGRATLITYDDEN